jgi:O-acetylhomoserine/O-acetylserine sulfhydrylase
MKSINNTLLINPSGKLANELAYLEPEASDFEDKHVRELEIKIAELHHAETALLVKSVDAAREIIINRLLKEGDNLIAFNTVHFKNENVQRKAGVEIRYTSSPNISVLNSLIDDNTKIIYVESVNLENLYIPDFYKISLLGKSHNIPVVVNNVGGALGVVTAPLLHGADIIIEDIQEWISDPEYTAVIAEGKNYNWQNGLFPQFRFPLFRQYDFEAGRYADELEGYRFSLLDYIRRTTGSYAHFAFRSIFTSSDNLENIEKIVSTRSLNSNGIANWLAKHRWITNIEYPGFLSHKSHENALAYFNNSFGNYISFYLRGSVTNFEKLNTRLQELQDLNLLKIRLFKENFRILLEINHNYELREIEKSLELILETLDEQELKYSLQEGRNYFVPIF